MRIYLSGQRTFGNRGCEAIVRATVALMREHVSSAEFLVPSTDPARDGRQWPGAAEQGVHFIRAWQPRHGRWWVRLQRLPVPMLKRARWPVPPPAWLRRQLESVDAVLAIGGDNYSLDYQLPTPVMAVDAWAMDMERPVALWGASVGPFDREPHFIDTVAAHLARMHLLAVRESISEAYLQDTMRMDRVTRMADPAFALSPDANDVPQQRPAPGGTLGFNLSPLLERYRRDGGDLRREASAFLRHAVRERGMDVLLIPHVDGLRTAEDGDRAYLAGLLATLDDLGHAVRMLPQGLNAPQTKAAISQTRFFIGARTHAAIAALSSGVPTVSIAYSVKARGIHRDLLGDEKEVLGAQDVDEAALRAALDGLEAGEERMRSRLAMRAAHARDEARRAAGRVAVELGLTGRTA